MNNQDFQNICRNLLEKYATHHLTDSDVDIFADLVTNVLEREDLRAEGTSYAALSERISHDYENDIAMNPLLARMYELCRMYERYRKRPLTDMEKKGSLSREIKPASWRKSALLTFRNDNEIVASCWWEDLEDCAGIAAKVAEVVSTIPMDCLDAAKTAKALLSCGNGFDPLDIASVQEAERLGLDAAEVPGRDGGIIALGEGLEQNRLRRGNEVKLSLADRSVHMDAYIIYGLEFYRELTGDVRFSTDGLEEIGGKDIDYTFSDADVVAKDWKERLGDVFAIPGSPNLVGTKKAIWKKG